MNQVDWEERNWEPNFFLGNSNFLGWNDEASSTTLGFGPAGTVNEEEDNWLDTSGQVSMHESPVTVTLTLKTFRHSIPSFGGSL